MVAWNDETPEGSSSQSKAHSKGILVLDEKSDSGLYILHSIPKYPSIDKTTGKI